MTIEANNHQYIVDGERYMFSAAAAALTGIGNDYISRMCRQGKLKSHRFAGQWLVSVSSLGEFLARRAGHRDTEAQ